MAAKPFCHFCVAILAAQFFIMPQSNVNGSFRLESVGGQPLDRFEDRHHSLLAVQRTSPPQKLAVNVPAKRVVRPF